MAAKRTKKAAKSPGPFPTADIGILGGTGLYAIDGITNVRETGSKRPSATPRTPSPRRRPSRETKVAFLSRHGRGHRHLPSESITGPTSTDSRCSGVRKVISVNAVGSLREEIRPCDLVFADQFIDKTCRPEHVLRRRAGRPRRPRPARLRGAVQTPLRHRGLAGRPVPSRRDLRLHGGPGLFDQGREPAPPALGRQRHRHDRRRPKRKLFREAEICYATMNLVTDYDCWHESGEDVTVEIIMENLRKNIGNAKRIIKAAVAGLAAAPACAHGCGDALRGTIVTDERLIPAATKRKLWPSSSADTSGRGSGSMSLVIVGSVAFDTIETPRERKEKIIGGSCTYGSLAASYFTRPGIVAVVGEDFPDATIAFFRKRKIDLKGLKIVPGGKTFHWQGRYGDDPNERETVRTDLNVFQDFCPEIPSSYRKADILLLANIDPDLQEAILKQVEKPRLTAMDTIALWINSKREAFLRVLAMSTSSSPTTRRSAC